MVLCLLLFPEILRVHNTALCPASCMIIVRDAGFEPGTFAQEFWEPTLALSSSPPPPYLTASAYKDIASLVQNQAELAVQGKPAAGRRRIDSIVTSQLSATTPNMPQEPGWISGTENVRGGFGRSGGGSRGFGRGQHNRSRGRGNRNFPY